MAAKPIRKVEGSDRLALTIHLEPFQYKRLRIMANKKGKSLSAMVRELVTESEIK